MGVINETILSIYGLPTSYAGKTYQDTGLVKLKMTSIPKLISKAPTSGTLTVQGTAAPVVNQLLQSGKKVRGVDFISLSSTAFENHVLPVSEVIVLYNVGVEVSTNYNVSGQVFRKTLKFYTEKKTLVIIETDLSKSELRSRYDFEVTNYLKIPSKPEEIWT